VSSAYLAAAALRVEDLSVSVGAIPILDRVSFTAEAKQVTAVIGPNGARVIKGKRTIIDNVRDVPTPSRVWHTLSVELRGAKLAVTLDGKPRFQKTLDAPPEGRIGLWSKADSQMLFDDFKVEPLNGL
jgi:ABC-type branched-subunit amino acid transport system ATPase component